MDLQLNEPWAKEPPLRIQPNKPDGQQTPKLGFMSRQHKPKGFVGESRMDAGEAWKCVSCVARGQFRYVRFSSCVPSDVWHPV